MKIKILVTLAIIGLVAFIILLIPGWPGKWSGSVKGLDGNDYPVTYVFNGDSKCLTGEMLTPQGDSPILKSNIDGNILAFNVKINGTNILHNARYYASGDTIALDMTYCGTKLHTILKRASSR